ncbi:MAG: fibronectin type III domain-containing protein, partial [Tumebacillaceae bacterium]
MKIGESTTPTFTVSGLTSTTTTAYTFTVTPTYNSGTTGQPGTLTVLVAPSNVHTTSVADTSVSLSWNAVTGATGYKVYGGESSTPITTSTPSATVANLVPGKAYTFTVVAYNAQAQGFA